MVQQQAEHDERMAAAQSVWDCQLRKADAEAREVILQCEQRCQSMQTDLHASHAARMSSLQSAHETAISSMDERHAVQASSTASSALHARELWLVAVK